MTGQDFSVLARTSFTDPALAVRQLQSLDLPMSARWLALLMAVALSSLLAAVGAMLFPVTVDTGLNTLTRQPLLLAALQLGGITLASWLVARVGRAFGGHGDFADALLVVVWIELLLLVIQAVQVVLMLIFPLFASLLGLAAIGVFVWLTVQMTKALHGFSNTMLVLLAMFATALLVGMVLSLVAGSLGLISPIGATP